MSIHKVGILGISGFVLFDISLLFDMQLSNLPAYSISKRAKILSDIMVMVTTAWGNLLGWHVW